MNYFDELSSSLDDEWEDGYRAAHNIARPRTLGGLLRAWWRGDAKLGVAFLLGWSAGMMLGLFIGMLVG